MALRCAEAWWRINNLRGTHLLHTKLFLQTDHHAMHGT
jgi:hypothetical protein